MFRKTAFDPAQLIGTNLPENTTLKGELKCDGNLHIGGLVDGQVECAGSVIVSERAVVRADIKARNVSVLGTVEGNIQADKVEILDGGRVLGDVDVIDLLLDEGGVVRGHVVMRKDEVPPLQPLPAADQADAADTPASPAAFTPPMDDSAASSG